MNNAPGTGAGAAVPPATSAEVKTASEAQLAPELCLKIHDHMVRARVLEERLITMYKQGDGYFWIGGPGEEAFNVVLGMLVHKGEGPAYDYLHLHYRSSATLLAMGADPVDSLRQMKNTAADPYSGGRNFVNHYSIRRWNVVPVSSPIEVQFSMAPGTAMAPPSFKAAMPAPRKLTSRQASCGVRARAAKCHSS